MIGDHVLLSNWDFKVKCFPYGILWKSNARFCARGDSKVEGVYYFLKYPPVVPWATVLLALGFSTNQVWATRKLDSSNAFVQYTLVEDV